MPKIIATPFGLCVADGYPIRKNLFELGFSWLPAVHEWAWKLPENEPIHGLDMAVTLKNLGAVFALDPYSKSLERVVDLYTQAMELLGTEEARKMFIWLLGSQTDSQIEGRK